MDAEKVKLRPFNSTDLEQMLDILTSSIVNQTYMLPDYKTRADAIPLFERLRTLSADKARFVRCIDLHGTAVGFLNDVEMKDGSIELGYVIHPDYHNRGCMTQALKLAVRELFRSRYKSVVCGAFAENRASLRVMEKAGMHRIGKTEIIPYRGHDHLCIYYEIRNEDSPC